MNNENNNEADDQKEIKNNELRNDSSYNDEEGDENEHHEQNINNEENNINNNENIERGKAKENENGEEMGENGEEAYKVEGEEEGGENYEQEVSEGEEEHTGEEGSQNDLHLDEQDGFQHNIEEYLPYDHKHDQYSCSCCEHFYNDTIKNKTNLPEARCEVCGNEINQISLNFYKNKIGKNKKKE